MERSSIDNAIAPFRIRELSELTTFHYLPHCEYDENDSKTHADNALVLTGRKTSSYFMHCSVAYLFVVVV